MAADANTPPERGSLHAYVGIGLLAGLFSTLFGVGGGTVMVPLMVLLLAYETKVATATSLAAIIVTATAGVATYGALGNIAWGYAILIGIPAVAGLFVGLWIKERLSTAALTMAFAALLVAVAVWLVVERHADSTTPDLTVAHAVIVALLGVVAGSLAGLFGVGGGILFVPALTLVIGLPQLPAEGASLLAILPVSLVGSLRQHRMGTIRWRPAMTMGAASVATAVAGAFIAEATPPALLRVLFACLVVFTAWQLVLRARAAR